MTQEIKEIILAYSGELDTAVIPSWLKAHHLVGAIILAAQKKNKEFHQVELFEMKRFSPLIEDDVYGWLDPISCIERRNIYGETGSETVRKALKRAKEELQS